MLKQKLDLEDKLDTRDKKYNELEKKFAEMEAKYKEEIKNLKSGQQKSLSDIVFSMLLNNSNVIRLLNMIEKSRTLKAN